MPAKAMITHLGNVFWPVPTKLLSTCKVDVTYFPFDEQFCLLKFGSWTYDGFQVIHGCLRPLSRQRSPCIFWACYGQDAAKRQTAGIKFTHMPKIRFSPRRGDSLHRFTSNLAGPTGSWVRLAVQNFTPVATGGGNAAPKYQKFPLFW